MPATSDVFNWTFETIVVFEVLSTFSARRDMVHKRNFYTRIEKLSHYIMLAQDRCEVSVFSREDGFSGRQLTSGAIDIPSFGISIPLSEVYRDVPLD